MNVLNSAEKVYVGDREVKRVYSKDQKTYQKFTFLTNFGSGFFEIDPEFSYGTYTQTEDYVEFDPFSASISFPIFAGYVLPTFNIEEYDELYLRILKPYPPYIKNTGHDFDVELFSPDLSNINGYQTDSFGIGSNLKLQKINPNIVGDVSNVGAIQFTDQGNGKSAGPFPANNIRVYDIVGVKNT